MLKTKEVGSHKYYLFNYRVGKPKGGTNELEFGSDYLTDLENYLSRVIESEDKIQRIAFGVSYVHQMLDVDNGQVLQGTARELLEYVRSMNVSMFPKDDPKLSGL